MKKRLKVLIIIAIIVAVPTVVWLSSLINCERLTQKYYKDFEDTYTQNVMLGDIEYFKVLRCDGETADVYYVSEDMVNANVLTFKNTDGKWIETDWNTIWSKTGSASGVIFPYWWHFVYGGF